MTESAPASKTALSVSLGCSRGRRRRVGERPLGGGGNEETLGGVRTPRGLYRGGGRRYDLGVREAHGNGASALSLEEDDGVRKGAGGREGEGVGPA